MNSNTALERKKEIGIERERERETETETETETEIEIEIEGKGRQRDRVSDYHCLSIQILYCIHSP